ncbi:XRE family transcriptional regulator [Amycolatopsis sp. WAC 04182]|uniref:helix-turn-helix domain-containing protein n=1 Tax=Amycolatopsis sp. WAC 04182 TaxID=2203198 RepID=UPI000F76DCF6|nr:helix-turn-helix transcriptional regulator [Amycolatopsis sp. WAC 04182]RSN58867.1 XRE family transcriptional regulator [Amycolatopsis sp. WAC 04182]
MSTPTEISETTTGAQLRGARLYMKLSLAEMAKATRYAKSYLGLVETGKKPVTLELLTAYERVLGDGMKRPDLVHPRLIKIDTPQERERVLAAVEAGEPDVFAQGPTSSSIDAAICPNLSENAIGHFRTWAIEGKTSTLRANAISVLGFLPGRENAEVVAQALNTDPKVRRLCVASEVSRLMQWDWPTSLQVADDPTTAPDAKKLGAKLAKEAVDPKDSESRWVAGWLLQRLAPVLG